MSDFPYRLLVFLLVLTAISCEESSSTHVTSPTSTPEVTPVHLPAFGRIIEDAGLKGSILIFDATTDQFFSNDFEWAETGFLPASTFKIPNSIIALETGIIDNAETMFYWDGEPRGMSAWEADLSFDQAFKRSCVPCYQEVARKIGVERMREHLDQFDYGDIDVDSSNIDMFWLQGNSRITQQEQIDFLRRIVSRDVPMSDSAFATLNTLMLIEKTDQYQLFGKTGWSISGDNNNGWFVGFVTQADNRWYFATNVVPGDDFEMSDFPRARVQVTRQALQQMGILPSS